MLSSIDDCVTVGNILLDANFQHRRKDISSEERDPALSDGLTYFVRYAPYMAHLKKYSGEKQPVRSLHK